MNKAFGYQLNSNAPYFFELKDKEKDRLKACSDMVYNRWTVRLSAYYNDIPKSTLHLFIHKELKNISEDLYFDVLKQIDWNIHHHRRNV